MTLVPLRDGSDRKVRHICRIPASALATLNDYAEMLEQLEVDAGNAQSVDGAAAKKRRRATLDHVITTAITDVIAKDRAFVEWRKTARANGGRNGSRPAAPAAAPRTS